MNIENPEFFNSYNISQTLFAKNLENQNSFLTNFNYNYGMVNLVDDTGFILSEKKEKLKFKKLFDSLSLSSLDYYSINIFLIRFDKVVKSYERKYKKLQNVFAELGGLMNSFIMIGKILVFAFNKNKFYYEMINHVLGVESLDEKL